MDLFERASRLVNRQAGRSVSVRRNVPRSGLVERNDNSARHRNQKRYRYGFYLLAVIFAAPVNAQDVGGISATAAPTATSSGSVSNQAVQVLQGNAIQNVYGSGISCQGPTLTVTPYLNNAKSWGLPYEYSYPDPVYDLSDLDDDGRLDNPGEVLFYKDTRTGQKDNYNWNVGLSIQATIPLDGGLQERCKAAVDTQLALQKQALASRRLDFEISRLKHCGELKLKGIRFAKGSPYEKVCADVLIYSPTPHTHVIPSTISEAHVGH
jgi:hypothetical protein